jgi:hypothetical protein
VILSARDAAGKPADLFGDSRGTYVTLDLLAGTSAILTGPPEHTHHLTFTGPDGTLSLDWRVTRT